MDISSFHGSYMQKKDHHMYIKPAKQLEHMIAHYTITFSSKKAVECEMYHIVPDGSGCIIIQQGDKLDTSFWGAMSEIVVLKNDIEEVPERFFVEFLPGGLYQVSGEPQKKYRNVRSSLANFHSVINEEIRMIYHRVSSYDELIEEMNTYFIDKLTLHPLTPRILEALTYINACSGDITMTDLAFTLNITNRQLLRDFHTYIGLSGKEFANIVRFNKLLKHMHENVGEVALQSGFFDQAHFNKAFKQITKTTPKKYLQNLSDFYKENFKF